jgi:[methyl-Co(III) methanol-specific corrinoid protein]:coenzyme M methyltransferase
MSTFRLNSKDANLSLLRGATGMGSRAFSVLPNVVLSGLRKAEVAYSETHRDPEKMARAAASTYELFGYGSAIVPFDLCVEAEALGAEVDFHDEAHAFIQPVISKPIDQLNPDALPPLRANGRVPLVAYAIQRLKESIGREIMVGAVIPGPFTLGWQLFGIEAWLLFRDSNLMVRTLNDLARGLADVAQVYSDAGADLITVHEMGGSPQVIGPTRFAQFVKPALKLLLGEIHITKILSICGDTNAIVDDLPECGADALNLDHRNDLRRTRKLLPDSILLGNLDPVGEIADGNPKSISRAVERCAAEGASAVVPGCDLFIETPNANMVALSHSGSTILHSNP